MVASKKAFLKDWLNCLDCLFTGSGYGFYTRYNFRDMEGVIYLLNIFPLPLTQKVVSRYFNNQEYINFGLVLSSRWVQFKKISC